MSKRLNGNGRWESSRMMLPEHREQFLERAKNIQKRTKPIMDEQHLEELIRTLGVSVFNELKVTVTVWEDFGDRVVRGKITKVDTQLKRIKVEQADCVEWVPF